MRTRLPSTAPILVQMFGRQDLCTNMELSAAHHVSISYIWDNADDDTNRSSTRRVRPPLGLPVERAVRGVRPIISFGAGDRPLLSNRAHSVMPYLAFSSSDQSSRMVSPNSCARA